MPKYALYLIAAIVIITAGTTAFIFITKQKAPQTTPEPIVKPTPSPAIPETTVKIGQIIANPRSYSGKTVIIEGIFGGYRDDIPGCDYTNLVMKTRSDEILYDETGCLYMGNVEYLTLVPTTWNERIGTRVKIRARVELINGKPFLSQ